MFIYADAQYGIVMFHKMASLASYTQQILILALQEDFTW